jgi:hypothetical protein
MVLCLFRDRILTLNAVDVLFSSLAQRPEGAAGGKIMRRELSLIRNRPPVAVRPSFPLFLFCSVFTKYFYYC